jgi:pimeloyl-ACP methyl ester carboxylesterase
MSSTTRNVRILRITLPSLLVAGGLGALDYLRGRFQRQQVLAEDVWFPSEDETELHGWWIRHPKAYGTVLYCHGNSGNVSSRIGVFRHLRRLRVNILAFDYRGYGRSSGEPSEQGLFRDARAAYQHLTTAIGEEPQKIILFGHSLGGAVAIDTAQDCPVAGMVLQSTFTDLRDMARAIFPQLPLFLVTRNHFRSIAKVNKLSMPKLFIHGTADGTVPIKLGRKLYEQAAEPKEWYEVPHAGHNDVYRFGGMRYLWKLVRFRNRCLKG